MDALLKQLAVCIDRGKAEKKSPFPPDMQGQDGASEITQQLLAKGVSANDILKKGLMVGMNDIGEKFGRGEAFIPELLIAAKAMNAAMIHLKPYFESGEAQHRGNVILGTVAGDLHDIGKNIVRMVLEGDGWNVIDLGVDVTTEKFLTALTKIPGAFVGMSALLTTTMVNMESSVKALKEAVPGTRVFVGGAPLSLKFSEKIGADGYFPDPHSFAKYLEKTIK
jgi:5-methyltetrahydrofolate--homocysteine methyltransferase